MDFVDQINALAAKISSSANLVQSEAAARSALIEPFIRAMGYDTGDLTEVVPEYGANVDVPDTVKNKRVDYGILQNGKPIILIECKWKGVKLVSGYPQLFAYFAATEARIGILTDGLTYQFYADLERPGLMDKKPFLVLDMQAPQPRLVNELKRLTKPSFNMDAALVAATELKFTEGIKSLLRKQLQEPDDEFIRFFFKTLCPDNAFTGKLREEFLTFVPRSLSEFIREEIDSLLDEAAGRKSSQVVPDPSTPATPASDDTVAVPATGPETTAEEMEGYYIVKTILREVIDPNRVQYKDWQGFFNILLDGKNNKPLCRLYFNNADKKSIGLFDKGGNSSEEKVSITGLNDIYLHTDRIKAAASSY